MANVARRKVVIVDGVRGRGGGWAAGRRHFAGSFAAVFVGILRAKILLVADNMTSRISVSIPVIVALVVCCYSAIKCNQLFMPAKCTFVKTRKCWQPKVDTRTDEPSC